MVKRSAKQNSDNVKSLEEHKASYPEQLTLFGLFGEDNKKYNNTIELYDFMPKYFWGKQPRIKVEKPDKNDPNKKILIREMLEKLERPFECRGNGYKLTLHPATITGQDGIDRDFYPGKREEAVEFALRKLMADGHGTFLDDSASVVFTLYQLEQELIKMGHNHNKNEIKEALQICKRATLVVISEDGSKVLESNIFETLGLQTQEEWKSAEHKTKCFVRFNPLVTKSIRDKSFRRFNYEKNFELISTIARLLHRRMSHHFLQASLTRTYEMKLTTMLRDFGITRQRSLSDNIRDLETALKELQAKEIILTYQIKKILDANRRNKLEDALITIIAHPRFSAEIVLHNEHRKKIVGIFPPVPPR